MNSNFAKLTILLIIFTQLLGCKATFNSASDESELLRNKHLWQQNNLPNYNFVIARNEGGQTIWAPVLIKVRDGKAALVVPTENVNELVKLDYSDLDNFEKVFAKIKESFDQGDRVRVTYNDKFGYPEKILIEFKGGGVDSWNSIEITRFEVPNTKAA
jgi:hypothetical protein